MTKKFITYGGDMSFDMLFRVFKSTCRLRAVLQFSVRPNFVKMKGKNRLRDKSKTALQRHVDIKIVC